MNDDTEPTTDDGFRERRVRPDGWMQTAIDDGTIRDPALGPEPEQDHTGDHVIDVPVATVDSEERGRDMVVIDVTLLDEPVAVALTTGVPPPTPSVVTVYDASDVDWSAIPDDAPRVAWIIDHARTES